MHVHLERRRNAVQRFERWIKRFSAALEVLVVLQAHATACGERFLGQFSLEAQSANALPDGVS